jgi:NPCBM/NEW2 domain
MTFFLGLLLAGATEPEFAVRTVDGTDRVAPIRKLTADGAVRLGGDKPTSVRGEDILCLKRRGGFLPPLPPKHALFLSNGDCLPLDPKGILKLHNERLLCTPAANVKPDGAAEVEIPYASLTVLWQTAPANNDEPEDWRRRLLLDKRKRDVVFLHNGDRVEGTLTALDWRKGCSVKTAIGPVEVPWADVAVVAFNSEFQSRRLPKEAYARVVLTGGARLSFSSVELEAGEKPQFSGKMLAGPVVRFPLEDLLALDRRQGRTVYLSDMKPKNFEHTPYLDLSWPLLSDAAVTGRALRVGGDVFDKGLGMHARSRVTYTLDGAYQRFEALVGLDVASGKRGRVKIAVLVDGKKQKLGIDRELTAKDAPREVRVAVHNAKELTLLVDFGSTGDVQGHVNWAEARLIK